MRNKYIYFLVYNIRSEDRLPLLDSQHIVTISEERQIDCEEDDEEDKLRILSLYCTASSRDNKEDR